MGKFVFYKSRLPTRTPTRVHTHTDEMMAAFWPSFKYFDQDRNARISADEITAAIGSTDELERDEIEHMIRAMGGQQVKVIIRDGAY